jgi:asparagine synthase (glutamine-hydrolysing)
LALRPGTVVQRGAIERMCAALGHRGPDDNGLFWSTAASLGVTRLSIIDVAGGHQPVSNESGTVWVALNGEIYNYRALRQDLAAAGHRFSTQGDTEVIAHLYEEHGAELAAKLRGMFALAVWDAVGDRLLLARDRLGIKPLFYGIHDGALWFGSEIKALLAAGFPRRLAPRALHDYLTFDYVPGPRCMFEGIHKLEAGCTLEARPAGRLVTSRYWDFPPQEAPTVDAKTDETLLKEQLTERLADAVQVHMVSDVPIGAFLSGGVDSGVVVALMSRFSATPIRTYSVGFRERSYDELPGARQVAALYGTEHTEIVVEPHVQDVIGRLVDAFDEPFADSSAVGSWYVAQVAARQVKVVLSGDGGDEIFGGYVIYQADRLRSAYSRLPMWLSRRTLPWLAERLPASDRKMSWDLKARRFILHAADDPLVAHVGWRTIFTDDMKHALYAEGFAASDHDTVDVMRQHFLAYPGGDLLNRLMVVDARVSLVDDMLTKVDRTSMAHGLEVRVPLLDHLLVEWMTKLPSCWKVRRLTLKRLLRSAARDLLPSGAADRPKAGFHVPVPIWLRGELRSLVEDQLAPDRLKRQGIFDVSYVSRMVVEHMSGKRDHSRNLWGLLLFGLWYERHLEG